MTNRHASGTEGSGPEAKPWYRHFWLWFVLTPPIVSVFVGLGLVFAAVTYGDSVVVDDRIDVGRATEQKHHRERLAGERGIRAELSVDTEDGRLGIVWFAEEGEAPETLQLSLIHPTRAELDLRRRMEPAGGGRYDAALGEIGTSTGKLGRRYVQLEPEDRSWRLVGELQAGDSELRLAPREPVFSAREAPR